jgi:hypothetical protein
MKNPRLVKFVISKIGWQADLERSFDMRNHADKRLSRSRRLSKELETKWTQLGSGASSKARKPFPGKTT